MKHDFKEGPEHINIQPWPNPKPLKIERVIVSHVTEDDKGNLKYGGSSTGFIVNANLHPSAITGKG